MTEYYYLLKCDAVYSGRSLPTLEGMYCLYFQDLIVSQAGRKKEAEYRVFSYTLKMEAVRSPDRSVNY
jgi:hypothetical protein